VNTILYNLAKFLASIIVPYFLRYVEPNATWSTKTLLGVSIFLGWSAVENTILLRRLDAERKRHTELWVLEHDFDLLLSNIRKYYRAILAEFHGESDLFKNYFEDRFSELAAALQKAAERRELFVKDFHFQRIDLLLSEFRSDATGILRYVWIIHKGESLFTEEWKHYCDQILSGTNDGAIRGVRALLVLGEGVTEDDTCIKKLAGFYEFSKSHDYRLVGDSKYRMQARDNRIDAQYIDFGIYGSRYIFLTQSYGDVTAGMFCKDAAVISRYVQFFDLIWESNAAKKLQRASVPRVKLPELFELTL
jgi:hypothetical protein